MTSQSEPQQDLQHIRQMMERSSRFISLSGLSGISAGLCALAGAAAAYPYVTGQKYPLMMPKDGLGQLDGTMGHIVYSYIFWIAVATLVSAFLSALIFTYFKSKKQGLALWDNSAKRLLANVLIPMIIGGALIAKLIIYGNHGLIAPCCLLFYGLALVNASKYTMIEIRYLGYTQLALGLLNLLMVGYGLLFWSIGFGLMHIIYGAYMWQRYEYKTAGS